MTLEELRARHALELQERRDAGVCGCGCGETVVDRRGRRVYVNERHKSRAHKTRLKAEADLLGIPVHLSMETAEAAAHTGNRRGDAPARRKRAKRAPRPGVSIYLPRPELVVELALLLDEARGGEVAPEDLAELEFAVARARGRLERRRSSSRA